MRASYLRSPFQYWQVQHLLLLASVYVIDIRSLLFRACCLTLPRPTRKKKRGVPSKIHVLQEARPSAYTETRIEDTPRETITWRILHIRLLYEDLVVFAQSQIRKIAYAAAGFSSKHSLARLKRYRDSYPSNESPDSRRFIAEAAVGQLQLSQRSNIPDKTNEIIPYFQFSHHPQRFQKKENGCSQLNLLKFYDTLLISLWKISKTY